MVLTLGFEPSLADPQSAVLTNNTKLGWPSMVPMEGFEPTTFGV